MTPVSPVRTKKHSDDQITGDQPLRRRWSGHAGDDPNARGSCCLATIRNEAANGAVIGEVAAALEMLDQPLFAATMRVSGNRGSPSPPRWSARFLVGVIRFGVTTTRDGRLVSLHFVGRSSFTGASVKVFLLSSEEPFLEGTWKLINPFTNARLIPDFNGAGPLGR